MKQHKNDGMVLILVIVLMALIGAALVMLTAGAKTLMYDANRHYLQACNRNLAASAYAWAQKTVKDESGKIPTQKIELNTSTLGLKNADLTVSFASSNHDQVSVDIQTRCTRGKVTRQFRHLYKISTKTQP